MRSRVVASGYSRRQQRQPAWSLIASATSPGNQREVESGGQQEALRKLADKDRAEAAALTAQAEALAKAEEAARDAVAASLGKCGFVQM